jgi:hypothetical protein
VYTSYIRQHISTAADSGDTRRIQGQIQHQRHLDGYRYEIRQIAEAAQRPTTDADTTADISLITDTNLDAARNGY